MTINYRETYRKYLQGLSDSTLADKSKKKAHLLAFQPYLLKVGQREVEELELDIINEEIERRKDEAT